MAEGPDTDNVPGREAGGGRSSVLFSGSHTVATSALQVVGAFATAVVIARVLGPEGKGAYDLFVTTAILMNTFLGMSLASGITYVAASGRVDVTRLTRESILFAGAVGVVAGGILAVLSGGRFGSLLLPSTLGAQAPLLAGLTVGALALSTLFRAVLTGQRRFIAANHRDLAKQVAGLLSILAAVGITKHFGGSMVNAAIVANLTAVLIASFLYLSAARRVGAGSIGVGGLGACFAFAIPSHLATVVQFLNYRLDVFFVNGLAGPEQLGLYQIAVLITQSLSLVPSAAQAVLFPTVAASQRSREVDRLQVARANRLLMIVSLAGGLVILVLAPWAIPAAFGAKFSGSVSALYWLLPGSVVFTASTVLAGYFAGIGRPRTNLVVSTCGLLVTIPLDLILIPRWGIRGAAIASSLSYATSSVAICWLFVRETGLSVKQLVVVEAGDIVILRDRLESFVYATRSRGPRPKG